MNEDTIVSVHCYAGDEALVRRALPVHCAHGCPVIILSPEDSPVVIAPHICKSVGKRAYIGSDSWTRQHEHLKYLLTFPHNYFLLNDADSFCISAKIDPWLYREADGTLWSNEVTEPRPHASPYPKIAAQPPYFLTRQSIQRMLDASARVPVHEITPYLDFAMLAWACEAGLQHRAFTELEHAREDAPHVQFQDSWQQLAYRIQYFGTTMMHPIKTQGQVDLCVNARKFYEQQKDTGSR